MKKLFHYKVSIYKNHKYSYQKDEFIFKAVNILAENERYIVINDWYFTKLEKSGKGYGGHVLNKEKISIRTNNHILDDGIFYELYSEKKRRPATIKKNIIDEINLNFSWLINELDLGVIK